MVEIIKRATMPDGTFIQLEDWRKDYPDVYDNFNITAYPICQNTVGKWIESGEKFRLDISRFSVNDDVKQIFEDLTAGKIALADLCEYFWNTDLDECRLGLISYVEYRCRWIRGYYEK